MLRLNMLLFIAICASAFYLIHVEYESRLLNMERYEILKKRRELEVERQKLIASRSAFVSPFRIERLARESLDMVDISPLSTHFAIGVLDQARGAHEPLQQPDSAATTDKRVP